MGVTKRAQFERLAAYQRARSAILFFSPVDATREEEEVAEVPSPLHLIPLKGTKEEYLQPNPTRMVIAELASPYAKMLEQDPCPRIRESITGKKMIVV